MLLVDDSNRNIFQSIARIEESLPVLERPQAGEDAYTSELKTMVSSIIALHYVYTIIKDAIDIHNSIFGRK